MQRKNSLIFVLTVFSLTSCANNDGGGPLGIVALSSKNHVAAAEPLFSRHEDRCFSSPAFILSLISVDAADQKKAIDTITPPSDTKSGGKRIKHETHLVECRQLAEEIRTFLHFNYQSTDPQSHTTGSNSTNISENSISPGRSPEEIRNNFIDAMTSASNKKCQDYIAFLKAYDGNINNTFGIGALVTAAVVPVAGPAASALGAASAISSGTRTTFNSNSFANQSIQVISTAFQKARQTQFDRIQNLKQCDIKQYSVLQAIGDVYDYHGACSVTAGLTAADSAVQRSDTVTLEAMQTMMSNIKAIVSQAATMTSTTTNSATTDGDAGKPSGNNVIGSDTTRGITAGTGGNPTVAPATGTGVPAPAAAIAGGVPTSGSSGTTRVLACPFSTAGSTTVKGTS